MPKEWIFPKEYDVIVVGAGHAGCEAALAAARMGCKTLMLTQNLDTIGAMSCNPSIGGVAKGQLVREIDALGGEMAKNTDRSGLQFKMLNVSKGAAVHSPRAQCDKKLYQFTMKETLESEPNLDLLQEEAAGLWMEGDRIAGVQSQRETKFRGKAVILTTGTFLNGLAHIGLNSFPSGRAGDRPSVQMAVSLRDLGFEVGRLKTGTPMRLAARSIDFSKCELQPSDDPPVPFSHATERITNPLLPCYVTYTASDTHAVIRDNLDRSPLYSGLIKSIGPRYCPSIEDKVVKFPHKERHQIFLEPEGYKTREIYVNGLSTSLPEDVQLRFVRTVKGLENAVIMRFGYAIEYDFCWPTQLHATLETKKVPGLYFAGQLNGTTGYEEAAAQGLVAGVNAALKIKGEPPLILSRDQAYIGVMIDDLVTKGVDEPYRMFTSRAEYRLTLRSDNADLRLYDTGRKLGLISEESHQRFSRYRDLVFGDTSLNSADLSKAASADLSPWSAEKVRAQRETMRHYAAYIKREQAAADRMGKWERVAIPEALNYDEIKTLSLEARHKLKKIRPGNLGQASRVPGLTPADIHVLWVYIEKHRRTAIERAAA